MQSISSYINPNTRGLTSNYKNTAIKDKETYNEAMSQHLLNPVEDLVQVLKTPIKLAKSSSLSRQNNSVNIAEGQRIRVNGSPGFWHVPACLLCFFETYSKTAPLFLYSEPSSGKRRLKLFECLPYRWFRISVHDPCVFFPADIQSLPDILFKICLQLQIIRSLRRSIKLIILLCL